MTIYHLCGIIYFMTEWKASTPIDSFEHSATGSLIDIVSMVHVGLPRYYQNLGDYITSRQDDGFQVHHEGIAPSDDFVPRNSVEKVKNKLFQLSTDASINGLVILEIGSEYTNQGNDQLFYEAGSSGEHDVTEAEYITGLSVLTHAARLIGNRRLSRSIRKASRSKTPAALDERIFGIVRSNIVAYEDGDKRHRSPGDKFVIQKRNEIALAGVDGALEVDDAAKLVLVWGLGHLAGLRSGLVDRGYEHVGRQEVEAAFSRTILERSLEDQRKALVKLQAKITRQENTVRNGSTWNR